MFTFDEGETMKNKSHKKNNYEEQEKFYNERLFSQQHLNGGALPILTNQQIREQIGNLTNEQVVLIATLIFNQYEEEYKHIWFAKGVREHAFQKAIESVLDMQKEPMFEIEGDDNRAPIEWTGMGIDDFRRGY